MRTRKTVVLLLFLTPILIIANALLWAAATGKITGKITDKQTGDPIAGASVMVMGTNRGAMTGLDGEYVIPQLEPGVYTIQVKHLDYETLEVTDVEVKADVTTTLSLKLKEGVSELQTTITVKGERDQLDVYQTANTQINDRETILRKPVTIVKDLIDRVGRVVEPDREAEEYIRGGRAGEVSVSSDGNIRAMCLPGIPEPGGHFPPAHGGSAIVNGEPFDAMFFKNYGVNPFVDTEDDHFSTFAIDVDDASFVMTRSYLERGHLPPNEAVRVEEFVNHFDYDYPAPSEQTFRVFFEGAPSRFGSNCDLLKIGIKGKEVRPEHRKPANLVFVIDVSGSMQREDRLELVKKALRLLLDELTVNDDVGLVVYGSNGRVVLEPTGIADKARIEHAIESLHAGGSTFAEEGIKLGYRMAEKNFEEGKINRIILCSDGVANVGRTGADDILKDIKRYADMGITLTTVGFGMGNYNDVLMEKLGNKGNGSYAYVDDLAEARRIFVENLTGTLQVIARDVKIQVDFNPEIVRSYRLLGYENRDVEDKKFRDDKEDGGEVGAGHEATALYEVKYHGDLPESKLGTVFIRYKDPDRHEVDEINYEITAGMMSRYFERTSNEFKLAAAAAEFSEILRRSYWARNSSLADVLRLVKEVNMGSDSPQVIELMSLVSKVLLQYEQQLANN